MNYPIKMKYKITGLLLAMVGFTGPIGALQANEQIQLTPNDHIQLTREVIQTRRQAIITLNMGFTESESKAFWPVYNEYRSAMKKVGDRRVALIESYAEAYNENAVSDEIALELMEEFLSIENKRIGIKEAYLDKFAAVLPTTKVMKFYQIDNKLDTIINFELAAQIPLVNITDDSLAKIPSE